MRLEGSVAQEEVDEPRPAAGPSGSDPHLGAQGQGLVIQGVDRSYRDRPILRDVSLNAARGSCVLIRGANGVGKTTLLRVIAGIITADAGSVAFDGIDPVRERRAYQRRLGFLAAGDRGLYARLTVRQNLEFWGKIALLPKDRRASGIREGLERFGLTDLAGRRCDRLSMGQRQRVRLAMTIMHRPDLMLLDEPTTSLDEEGAGQVRDALEELRSRGATVLCCAPTGDTPVVAFDTTLTIQDGRLWP